jgi:lipid-binding SYLF domain-containing protein
VKKEVACNVLACLSVLFLLAGLAFSAEASTVPETRIEDALKVLQEMATQEDCGTMSDLLAKAKGVAIFPSVVKAGLMLGARHGKGVVLKRDSGTGKWYGPSFVEMTGLSYGLQIGVQSTALVLVITNERGMTSFEEGSFTFGGDLTVAAGPLGRHLEAGTDIELKAAIYSYSMSKGAFIGVSLEGAKVKPDEAANELYWKRPASSTELLQRKATDSRIRPLITELNILVLRGGGKTSV